MSVVGGLLAAASYGTGDFFAGIASRRDPCLRILAIAHPLGALSLGLLALGLRQPLPAPSDLFWGSLAALCGLGASLLLLRALAIGPISTVSVASGTLAAGVPVFMGLLLGETLGNWGWLGVCAVMLGMTLLSFTPGRLRESRGLGLGILAGLLTGVFSVLIGQTQAVGMLWTLAVARLVSSLVVVPLALKRVGLRLNAPKLVFSAAPGDSLGNFFFLLAIQGGGLALGSLLASLYPAFTTLLAVTVLRERLRPIQWLGVAVALGGAALLTRK